MNRGELVDILHKEADICSKKIEGLYKKAFIILATLGGLGTFLIKVEISEVIKNSGIALFALLSIGLLLIYLKISKMDRRISNVLKELDLIKKDK